MSITKNDKSCKYANKYKGTIPPKCNCYVCWRKWYYRCRKNTAEAIAKMIEIRELT